MIHARYQKSLFDARYSGYLYDALPSESNRQDTSQEKSYQWYLAIWNSAITRVSDRPEDLLLSTMGIIGIALEEGEERSQERVFDAFIREFRKKGITDSRVITFRDAIKTGGQEISRQWRELIDEFDKNFPLLVGGIAPISNELDLTLAGPPIILDGSGSKTFPGSAFLSNTLDHEHSLHPCRIVVSNAGSFTCLVPFDYKEHEHHGRWQLMPFDAERMEWVSPSRSASVPSGRQPVQGGYGHGSFLRDNSHGSLYCGLASKFVGKVGNHLRVTAERFVCKYGRDGREHGATEYKVL